MPTDRTPAQDRSESYRAWDSWRSTHPSAPIGDAFLGGWAAARSEGAASRDAEVRALREIVRLAAIRERAEEAYADAEATYNASPYPAHARIGLGLDRLATERAAAVAALRAALAAGPAPVPAAGLGYSAAGLDVRPFPILWQGHARPPDAPVSVPWSLVAPHDAQARRNHGQSLIRLAERGGLSVDELVAVLEDRRWHRMNDAEAVRKIAARLAAAQPAPESEGGTL